MGTPSTNETSDLTATGGPTVASVASAAVARGVVAVQAGFRFYGVGSRARCNALLTAYGAGHFFAGASMQAGGDAVLEEDRELFLILGDRRILVRSARIRRGQGDKKRDEHFHITDLPVKYNIRLTRPERRAGSAKTASSVAEKLKMTWQDERAGVSRRVSSETAQSPAKPVCDDA